jgi:hypothetical protein
VKDPQADAILQRVAEQLSRRGVQGLHERGPDCDADLQGEQGRESAIRVGSAWKTTRDRACHFIEQ